MRTLKSEGSGVQGSELLSVLMRPDGTRPEPDGCTAQVVTMRVGGLVGGREVTAVVLAPETAFHLELAVGESSPLMMERTLVEGEKYDWFELWDRLMVWRPKEGPATDARAEAALLSTLRRRLASTHRNRPEAVEALCSEVFGGHLRDLYEVLNDVGEMCMGPNGYEMQRRADEDDISVALTREVDPSELNEILDLVPEDWKPVMRRSVARDTNSENSHNTKCGTALKCCGYTTATIVTLAAAAGLMGLAAHAVWPHADLWPWNDKRMTKRGFERSLVTIPFETTPGMCPQFGDNQTAVVWTSDAPASLAPCGSGTLLCGNGTMTTRCSDFGSPWPVSFPMVWNTANQFPNQQCQVLCHTPQQTYNSLNTRLLRSFPLDTPSNASLFGNTTMMSGNTTVVPTMSREEQIQRLLAALVLDPKCSGSAPSWREVSKLNRCRCNVASATCEVTAKQPARIVELNDMPEEGNQTTRSHTHNVTTTMTPNVTTTMTPNVTTTMTPNVTTTMTPNVTTTMTPNATTTMTPNVTTTMTPNVTTTMMPNVTTTMTPNATTTMMPNVTTTMMPNVTTTMTPNVEARSHNVTLTDVDTTLDRVSTFFDAYSEDSYTPGTCVYECKNLTPEAEKIVRQNREAAALRRAEAARKKTSSNKTTTSASTNATTSASTNATTSASTNTTTSASTNTTTSASTNATTSASTNTTTSASNNTTTRGTPIRVSMQPTV